MSEDKLTIGPWVACVSSSEDLDICTAIKDKGNGNFIVANDIDEEYEALLLALPDMFRMLQTASEMLKQVNGCAENQTAKEIDDLIESIKG